MKLRGQLLLGFAALLVLSTGVSALAYQRTTADRDARARVRHTNEVIDAAGIAQDSVQDLEASYHEFSLTAADLALARYSDAAQRYPSELQYLAELTADNPAQAARWLAIQLLVDDLRTRVLEPGMAIRQRVAQGTGTMDAVIQFESVGDEESSMGAIRSSFRNAVDVERQLLVERTEADDNASQLLANVLAWGSIGSVALGVLIAGALAQSLGRAMERLATVAQAIAAGDLSRRVNLKRRDEIGQAAAAFDSMAATLQHDSAERERAQAELESVLNSVGEGIYSIDRSGRARLVNHSAARLTGFTVEELQDHNIHELIHHSRQDGTPLPLSECQAVVAIVEGRSQDVRGETFWRKDGSSFPVQFTSVPIREGGVITGAVVTFHDISERQAIERMKDEFISVVSHELRTPLTSIRGSLGLLAAGLMGPISEHAAHMLHVALTNTDRLIRLINDILDIERIESGRVAMDLHLTNAHDLVRRAVEGVKPMADAAGVTIAECAESVQLLADPDRIVQTLTNLIGNAIKFSPRGACIEVSASRTGDEPLAHFSVQDHGRGIPADKIESIFGRFEQVDATDAREKGGTGLGLAISRSIVLQHGGRIWVDSVLGSGSTFHFVLPMSVVDMASNHDAGEGVAILLIDDDPDTRSVVGRMLADIGYRPLVLRNAREGVAIAVLEQPAAILLDLAMPDMDGWDTLRALKADHRTRDVPVVVLSGLDQIKHMRPPQAEAWLSKPVAGEDLRATLAEVLGRRAASDEHFRPSTLRQSA